MNIPKYATPLYGLGAVNTSSGDVPNIAVPIKIAGPGDYCDFDASANPQDVFTDAAVCAMGLACENKKCKEPGSGIPEIVLCQTDADCDDDFYCTNVGVCEYGSGSGGSNPPKQDDEQDSELVNCTDKYIIEQVQRAAGVEVDGKWGCDSQRALGSKGLNYRTVGSNCTGSLPNPCDYGQCVNGKCPQVAGMGGGSSTTGGNLVKVNEQIDEQKEESKTPWGWIIGGIVLATVAAGGGYYYYSTQKNKTQVSRKAKEPARTKTSYKLNVEYEGYSEKIDNELFRVVGSYSGASGTDFRTREHVWYFDNKKEAELALSRINKSSLASKVYAEIVSERPDYSINEP
jgi:hypothetical protein